MGSQDSILFDPAEVTESTNFEFLEKLPLLEFTSSLFSGSNLENCYIICAQHILETTRLLFNKLFELGLKKENLSVIGKCYSTNPMIYDLLRAEGIDVCSSSIAFDPNIPFDDRYNENMKCFLEQRHSKFANYEKVIVLDDGGSLLQLVHQLDKPKDNIWGIEQTSSGYNLIKNYTFEFPVINVALSKSKLVFETPVVLDLAIELAVEKAKDFNIDVKNILILGNGVMGSYLLKSLSKDFAVLAFDQNPFKTNISEEEFSFILSNVDLVFGCSGNTSLPRSMHRYLKKNVVLASTSSSDREFDIIYIREQIENISTCHDDLHHEGMVILNCGFPINFGNQYHRVDGKPFQLIRSLLLAAVMQISSQSPSSKGIINLDPEYEVKIGNEYEKLISNVHVAQGANR